MNPRNIFLALCSLLLLSSCGLKKDLMLPKDANAPKPAVQQSVDPATNIAPSTITNTQPPTAPANPALH